jgi:hypothetical protein
VRAALLLFLSVAHAEEKTPNARVVFEVKQEGSPPARWQLWTAPDRAHLKAPNHEIFWDLTKERRVDVRGTRSRDEPIVFGKQLRADELFPRGVKLKKLAPSKILGRSCQMVRHEQSDITVTGGTRKARLTWCVWKGLPIGLEYTESVCHKHLPRCVNETVLWKAVEIALDAAKPGDLNRPTASGTSTR